MIKLFVKLPRKAVFDRVIRSATSKKESFIELLKKGVANEVIHKAT